MELEHWCPTAVVSLSQPWFSALQNACAMPLLRRSIACPLQYFDSHEQGDTLSRVTNDVDLMTQSFNQSLVQMVSSIVLLIGSILMMFKTDWHLAVTAIVSVFAGFALSSIIMVKSQPLFKQQQDNLAKVSGYVEEIYSGHNIVISYNGRHQAKKSFWCHQPRFVPIACGNPNSSLGSWCPWCSL